MNYLQKGCEFYAKREFSSADNINEEIYSDGNGTRIGYVKAEYLILRFGNNNYYRLIRLEKLQETIASFEQKDQQEIASELKKIANSIEFEKEYSVVEEGLEEIKFQTFISELEELTEKIDLEKYPYTPKATPDQNPYTPEIDPMEELLSLDSAFEHPEQVPIASLPPPPPPPGWESPPPPPPE